MQEMKRSIKLHDSARTYPHEHVLIYPPGPKGLPENMFAFAYPEKEPIPVSMPELNGIAGPKMRRLRATGETKQMDKIMSIMTKFMAGTKPEEPSHSPSRVLPFQLGVQSQSAIATTGSTTSSGVQQGGLANSYLAFKSRLTETACSKNEHLAEGSGADSTSPPGSGIAATPLGDNCDPTIGPEDPNIGSGQAELHQEASRAELQHQVDELEKQLASMRAMQKVSTKKGTRNPPLQKKPSKANVSDKSQVVCKRPAARDGSRPKVPKIDGAVKPAPVDYNGARIYTDLKDSKFRVLLQPGDRYSEVTAGMSFKQQPIEQAWRAALRAASDR